MLTIFDLSIRRKTKTPAKMKTNETSIGICKVEWSFAKINGKISTTEKKQLKKKGLFFSDTHAYGWHKDAQSEIEKIFSKKGGSIVKIADKQFGLGVNSYNGFAKNQTTFDHSLISIDGNCVTSWPITKMQIENAVTF